MNDKYYYSINDKCIKTIADNIPVTDHSVIKEFKKHFTRMHGNLKINRYNYTYSKLKNIYKFNN